MIALTEARITPGMHTAALRQKAISRAAVAFLAGWWLAVGHLITAIMLAITIIGIRSHGRM